MNLAQQLLAATARHRRRETAGYTVCSIKCDFLKSAQNITSAFGKHRMVSFLMRLDTFKFLLFNFGWLSAMLYYPTKMGAAQIIRKSRALPPLIHHHLIQVYLDFDTVLAKFCSSSWFLCTLLLFGKPIGLCG